MTHCVTVYDSVHTHAGAYRDLDRQLQYCYPWSTGGSRAFHVTQIQSRDTDCDLFAIATAYHLACGVSVSLKLEQSALRQHLLECFECDCMTPFPREQTAVAPIQHDVSNDNSSINPELPTFTPKDDVQSSPWQTQFHILTYWTTRWKRSRSLTAAHSAVDHV